MVDFLHYAPHSYLAYKRFIFIIDYVGANMP
jgi:hypothetical protein